MLNEGVGGGLEWFWEGEELGLSAERMLGSRARGLRVEGPGRGMRAEKSVLLAAVLSSPRQTAGLIFHGEVGLGQRAVFPHWVGPGPAQLSQ